MDTQHECCPQCGSDEVTLGIGLNHLRGAYCTKCKWLGVLVNMVPRQLADEVVASEFAGNLGQRVPGGL